MNRWLCPHCHSFNTGVRCAWCGKPKPAEPKKEEPKK